MRHFTILHFAFVLSLTLGSDAFARLRSVSDERGVSLPPYDTTLDNDIIVVPWDIETISRTTTFVINANTVDVISTKCEGLPNITMHSGCQQQVSGAWPVSHCGTEGQYL